jgi:hypothetical protein
VIGGLALVAAGLVPGSAGGTETTRPQSLQAGLGSQQKAADRAVGTGIIRWDNTYAEASGYERFAYVLVARHFARQAAHLPGTSLVYMNGTTIYSRWSTGVSYEEALASGWLLKHADGSYFTNKRFRGYVADVGDRAYQERFIANVSAFLRQTRNDGVFIDDVLASPLWLNGRYPAKYPNNGAWLSAMLSFVTNVGAALRERGYYVLVNAGAYDRYDPERNTGATYARFYKQLAPHVSGIMNEYWVQSPDNVATMRSAGVNWDDYWAGWQQLVSVTQNAGAEFFGLTYGAGGDRRAIRYGRASFLLDWNGRGGAFVWSPTDTADPYNQVFVRRLGRPVSRKVERKPGVWQRTYERGVVLVNTTDSNVVVRLGRNQLTIPATDGLFARTPKR